METVPFETGASTEDLPVENCTLSGGRRCIQYTGLYATGSGSLLEESLACGIASGEWKSEPCPSEGVTAECPEVAHSEWTEQDFLYSSELTCESE